MKKMSLAVIGLVLVTGIIAGSVVWASGGDESTKTSGQVFIDVSYSGKEVELVPGQLLTVTLASNPTTGFKWKLAGNTDETVLKLASEKFVAPKSTLIGAGGNEAWTCKALTKGKTGISLEYSRPWEGGEKAVGTFILNVVVKIEEPRDK